MSRVDLVNIQKNFGSTKVLERVDLSIEKGEFLVLVGPSGCGKSTLLRILSGLEDPSEGDILLNGERINHVPAGKRNFALIFQNYALFPHMSVEQNILFGMKIRGEDKSQFASRLAEVANLLQLNTLLKRKPKELSGGATSTCGDGESHY